MIIIDIETQKRYEILPKKAGENDMICPVCSADRKKKNAKTFRWNAEKRVGTCLHCNATFKAENKMHQTAPKQYFRPQWKNRTNLTDVAVKIFERRGISQGTLKKMKIYSDREFMPQHNKECEVICFPYFIENELINVKYRAGGKTFKMVKDAELIFYNFNCIADNQEIIICEGEFDALTFIECGFPNAISVPNGAGAIDLTYLDNYIDNFEHVKTFYIASDFDEPGIKLRNELVRRLGYERCKIVTYNGCKDANELLCKENRFAVERAIREAREVPMIGAYSFEDIDEAFEKFYMNGVSRGTEMGISEIDECLRWETGRLAVWTGIPSHGKSAFVDFVSVKMNIRHGWKTLFYSPENHPLETHLEKMAKLLSGKEVSQWTFTREERDKVVRYIWDNFYILIPHENTTHETILERAKMYVKKCGIKQLVIDPYNCLEHKYSALDGETKYISRFLDDLTRFAKQYDILIHLVAHPRKITEKPINDKEKGANVPSMYDIAGSAHFHNKADFGICVYRDFTKNITQFIPLKVRFSNLGKPNKDGINLVYNLNNGRYNLPFCEPDNSNWLNGTTTQTDWTQTTEQLEDMPVFP